MENDVIKQEKNCIKFYKPKQTQNAPFKQTQRKIKKKKHLQKDMD